MTKGEGTMSFETIVLDRSDACAVEVTTKTLLKGELAVLPCDTIYGLSGLVDISEIRLRNVKRRPETKPFILLATFSMAKSICSGALPKGLSEIWPAPLTAILSDSQGGTTAVRVPEDPFLQAVLEACGSPIYSTSVNTSGEPSLLSFKEIVQEFAGKVELMIQGGEDQGTVASTLVDCTKSPYAVLRQGAFDASWLITQSEAI